MTCVSPTFLAACLIHTICATDSVLSSPQILSVPLLLLTNKQDTPMSMSATEIRQDYEPWDHYRRDSARRRYAEEEGEEERKKRRLPSLEVLGVSALEGCVRVAVFYPFVAECMGLVDRACVRQSTSCSCVSGTVGSGYVVFGYNLCLVPGRCDVRERTST